MRIFVRLMVFALMLLPTAVLAQQSPLAGLWSTSLQYPNGDPLQTIFILFKNDGGLQLRFLTVGDNAVRDWFGTYEAQNLTSVTYVIRDYQPKESCDGPVCLPYPPPTQLGQTISAKISLESNDSLIIFDNTGKPVTYVRQPYNGNMPLVMAKPTG